MTDLNTATIIGRLTRDGEIKQTKGGTSICTFSLAVNRSRKVGDKWEDEVSYFDFTWFGGENVVQYLTKGSRVAVEGRLSQDRWEKDGQKHSKVGIVVNHLQLLEGKKDKDDGPPF